MDDYVTKVMDLSHQLEDVDDEVSLLLSITPCGRATNHPSTKLISITIALVTHHTIPPTNLEGDIPSRSTTLSRTPSSGLWRRVGLFETDVSEQSVASILRVEEIMLARKSVRQ
jgi:hypothetical protein